jgi:hypothetical protein
MAESVRPQNAVQATRVRISTGPKISVEIVALFCNPASEGSRCTRILGLGSVGKDTERRLFIVRYALNIAKCLVKKGMTKKSNLVGKREGCTAAQQTESRYAYVLACMDMGTTQNGLF